MAISAITYLNKQSRNDTPIIEPTVTDTWRSDDANEVKKVVNDHAGVLQHAVDWTPSNYNQIFLAAYNDVLVADLDGFDPADYGQIYQDEADAPID